MQFQSLNKRQIIILCSFCLPLFALIGVSYIKSEQNPLPKLPGQKAAGPRPVLTKGPPSSLLDARERIKKKLEEAQNMSAEQFAKLQREDRNMAPTQEGLRIRLQNRLSQLEAMTPDEWNAEQRQREDQARQRGIGNRMPQAQAPDLAQPAIPFPVQLPVAQAPAAAPANETAPAPVPSTLTDEAIGGQTPAPDTPPPLNR